MEKKVAIIGAGVSGLVACKHAIEKGFNPIVFEARSGIGGIWSQTIQSTKLQSPKRFYQFSDFDWPSSVKETFPDHNQVMDYLHAYATRFNIIPKIKFNSKVTCIDYVTPSDELDLHYWDLWGGSGEPFSSTGRWSVTVQDAQDSSAPVEVYQVDFVILCIGKFSDLPNIPDFPLNKGPEVFDGKVLHSMDYAAMDDDCAAVFIKDKRVTVIGSHKSAIDIAAEVANQNGVEHPCTMLFKTVHWTVPEYLNEINFGNLNRFSEFMIHKPGEGFFIWLLALLLFPLLWIFSKLMESYLKWIQPLKRHDMVPDRGYLQDISSCMIPVLPASFYSKVDEGSLLLKKSRSFSFCKIGLVIDGEETPIPTDIVIFATGYKTDQKLKSIFKASYFQKCIVESSAPFYRECIHPRIPQLAILGYAEGPATLFVTEMRSKWLAHLLVGKFKLPPIREMEAEVKNWEECTRCYAKEGYKRWCVSMLLQIYSNDQLCKDMGCKSRRKKWFLSELFSPYYPSDYKM